MSKNARFWRNVTLIGLAHVAVIVAFVRWGREVKQAAPQSVVWMNRGGGDGTAVEKKKVLPPSSVKPPRPELESKVEPPKELEPEEDRPVLTSVKSDIQLPTPKPSPTSTSTPKASPTPKIKVPPKSTPKPKPKPTPTPKPKPSPKKLVIAKASPKPSPKLKPTPEEKDENKEEAADDAAKMKIAKAALAKNESAETEPTADKPVAAQTGSGKGTSAGTGGGHAGGAGSESQFGWYGSMLHDRFYSEWVQPATLAATGAKNSVLAKLRIEKDGRVSNFEIIRPSGNADVDDSVAAVAKRITQVDPLPPGLGSGDHYDVKINFELNSDQ
jgi:TonB family protein